MAGEVYVTCGCPSCGDAQVAVSAQKWRWLQRREDQDELVHRLVTIATRKNSSAARSV